MVLFVLSWLPSQGVHLGVQDPEQAPGVVLREGDLRVTVKKACHLPKMSMFGTFQEAFKYPFWFKINNKTN